MQNQLVTTKSDHAEQRDSVSIPVSATILSITYKQIRPSSRSLKRNLADIRAL